MVQELSVSQSNAGHNSGAGVNEFFYFRELCSMLWADLMFSMKWHPNSSKTPFLVPISNYGCLA